MAPPGGTAPLSDAKRALLDQRRQGRANGAGPSATVHRRTQTGPVRLSSAQEQLWYSSRLVPDTPVYNEVVSIRREGPLDEEALHSALEAIVHRHEAWRTTFSIVDGEPMQVVRPPASVDMPISDLSGLPAAEAEATAVDIIAAEAGRRYDLEAGPLVRAHLIRFGADRHYLYLGLHHIVFDGVSLYRIILPEIVELYDAHVAGRPPRLDEPPVQYADYAIWDREWAADAAMQRRVEHWRRRLVGAPTLQLPLDRARPVQRRFKGAVVALDIPAELASSLHALARRCGATLFQVAAAAFGILLQRICGQDDVVFSTVTDLRLRPELQRMVGYCLTPLVLRAGFEGDPTVIEAVQRVRDELLDGLQNVVPFERLVRELHPSRDPGVNPVFQVMIVLEPPLAPAGEGWSLHQIEPEISSRLGTSKVDLLLELDERPEGDIRGRLVYNTDLFGSETAGRVVRYWLTLLQSMATEPTVPISKLQLLSADEARDQLSLAGFPDVPYPHACLHHLVLEQVRRTPDAVAVEAVDRTLTFAELDRLSEQLAQRLRAAGVTPGGTVGLCTERTAAMVVGLLAVLRAGGAYLPLDERHPTARLAFMLADSGAQAVLVQPGLEDVLGDHALPVVALDLAEAPGGAPSDDPTGSPSDLAYILYTSGSTGQPKGVEVPHSAVVNLLTAMVGEFDIDASTTVLATTTYGFDVSVPELWLPLITGARMVLVSRDVATDARRLARALEESDATFMQATPSSWRMLVDSGWRGNRRLVAVTAGEALPLALAESLLERTAELWNAYGPTEATVYATWGRMVPGEGRITIGRSIANTQVRIGDRHLQPLPVGIPGELLIGGHCLARGYHDRPDLTAERFVPDPLVPGARIYRTGDRARLLADGRIEHLGRLDDQLKVRGFRIEPGEVEATLLSCDDIAAAAVVAREDPAGDRRLVAYVVPRGEAVDVAAARARLRESLPEHMVPSLFTTLPSLPLTANGKLDRNALPEPAADGLATAPRSMERVAPVSGLEQRLARIWERVLGVRGIARGDDFFDLGGHSLLALRMLLQVERELRVEVPLSSFFDGDVTIAALAASIEAASVEGAAGRRNTVAVRSEGESPIIFFIHPDESSMLTLRHFLGPLGSEQRIVGLLPERRGRRFDRSTTIEQLADTMLVHVRESQPHGPYHLAGYSVGGLLAYEIAGRLRNLGEEVRWLALLDAGTPAAGGRYLRQRLTLRERFARQRERGAREALRKTGEVASRELRAVQVRLRLRRPTVDFDWRGATLLAFRYRCRGNDAPMDLFVTDDLVAGTKSPSLGWAEVHGGELRIHRVDGEHMSMVKEPYVASLAAALTETFRAAR
jgi:amino acid adenylation domain-containing protein